MTARKRELDAYLERLESHLPDRFARFLKWSRRPELIWLRIPLAAALVVAGILGFLPILGFWMVPLGLLLLAEDITWLQRPLVAVIKWAERLWQRRRRR